MKRIRKYHRRLSVIFALPVLIVVITGILLILRSKLGFIQSPAPKVESVAIEKVRPVAEVIERLKSYQVNDGDISSIIFKPSKNLYSVRTKDYREFFLHPETLEVLKVGPKMSTLLIQLHEGTYFSKEVRDYVFFPSSLVLLFLWVTGMILFIRPKLKARQRKLNGQL